MAEKRQDVALTRVVQRLCAKASGARGESISHAYELLPEADWGYLCTQPLTLPLSGSL
jgi:hypothetical protein